jgi:hypothetical protein
LFEPLHNHFSLIFWKVFQVILNRFNGETGKVAHNELENLIPVIPGKVAQDPSNPCFGEPILSLNQPMAGFVYQGIVSAIGGNRHKCNNR